MGTEARAQVLVIGAGPVGLMTALQLKRHSVDVKIIDHAEPSSAKSPAVVLHPRTVEMLAEFGLGEPLRWQGHSFDHIEVFANREKAARLTLPVDGEFAKGALTLPQNVLRAALEGALRAIGVEVEYGLRFTHADQRPNEVVSWLTLHPKSGSGLVPPTAPTDAPRVVSKFVVGADGFRSTVRDRLGIACALTGEDRPFAFFDVPQPAHARATAELALAEYSSALIPLRGGSSRYIFELPSWPTPSLGAQELGELRRARMPWHPTYLDGVEWSGVRSFQPGIAERFGHGRIWLVGDACHVANPIGAQSMNVGFREARDLAEAIIDCLNGGKLEHLASGYAEQRRLEWHRLLALGQKSLGVRTPAWALRYFAQLISSLPASRDDLDDLLEQLGISML